MSNDNPFAGISKAVPNLGGNYVKAGQHLFKINALKLIQSQQSRDYMFIAELDTIESDTHTAGERVSWVANLKHGETALGNIRAFVAAAMQVELNEIDESATQGAVHEVQPCAGKLIKCQATQIKTKKGNDFTKCLWTSVEESDEDAAA